MIANQRTLLFFCAECLQAYTWSKGYLLHAQNFTHDALGHQQFSRFLERHAQPVLILVDVIAEDFRHEHLPRLARHHRTALAHRKLAQFYPHTTFRQSRWTRQINNGQHEHSLLLSALNDPVQFTPWLDVLRTQRIPLIGIQSVPHLSTQLVKKYPNGHFLLLSWSKCSGLRQSYFINGNLHFSRLIPPINSRVFSSAIEHEIPRLLHYLGSQNLPPSDTPLQVVVMGHTDERTTLQSTITPSPALTVSFLDVQNLATTLNAKKIYVDSDATPIFLQLLACSPLGNQYADADQLHIYRLWQLRFVVFLLAGMVILLTVVGMSYQFSLASKTERTAEELNAQTDKLTQTSAALKLLFPADSVPGDDMQKAVLMSQKLTRLSPSPIHFLMEFSHVLDEFPRIRLTGLRWKMQEDSVAFIDVDGELIEFNDDYRAKLNYLSDFQHALTTRAYTVTPQLLPLDVTPNGQLSDEIYAQHSPKFALNLQWKAAP